MEQTKYTSILTASALFAVALLTALSGCSVSGIAPSGAQASTLHAGIVRDWSQHHVVFSNPGSEDDAVDKGEYDKWQRITSSSRYRMQQIQRNVMWQKTSNLDGSNPVQPLPPMPFQPRENNSIEADQGFWSSPISNTKPGGMALDTYPAKFGFDPTGTPDCTNDYVVFTENLAGSTSQAQVIGLNNMYPSCTGTVPTVRFAYQEGTGTAGLSPVVSEDGKKIAWVQTTGSGSSGTTTLFVYTLDSPGASGNGTLTAPAKPGTGNKATRVAIALTGTPADTNSPPFVDYDDDILYIGDDIGKLHKVTGVFHGTPTEVTTSPWPVQVISGTTNLRLAGPVYDSVSKKIFIPGRDTGSIYCFVATTGAACSPTASIALGTGIQDAPIVDSTNQTLFIVTDTPVTNGVSAVTQINTSLASASKVVANIGGAGMDLYNGDFDNRYYNSVGTGHLYVCGGSSGGGLETLYSIGFNSSGVMSTTTTGSFQLVTSSGGGIASDCSPITENFNTTTNTDTIFLSVKSNGFSTSPGGVGPNCGTSHSCIISFDVTSGTFPAAAKSVNTTNIGTSGVSGFTVDNTGGTSQIYYGDLTHGAAIQLSQSGLE